MSTSRTHGTRWTAVVLAAVVFSATLAFPAAAHTVTGKIGPDLLARALTYPDQSFNVIVRGRAPDKLKEHAAEQAKKAVERRNGRVGEKLSIVASTSATVTGRQLLDLVADGDVDYISLDDVLTAHFDPALGAAAATNPAVLEVAAPSAWRQLGVTGKGIGVAVVDSGIAPHPDLAGRIVAAVDFTSAPTDPSSSTQALVVPADPGGHGTHVAGLIAGDGTASGGAYTGVAPGANLIDVRVITAQGTTTASMLIRGLQWVLANRYTYNIRVVNISAGGKTTTSYRDDPLAAAVEVLIFAGITVVVSAGNDGPGDMTITSPGTDPYVITVGAVDDNATATVADDSVASWSSRGPTRDGLAKPDIAAPGRKIVSLRSPGSTLDLLLPQRMVAGLDPLNPQYFTLSGTSAAAPIVTGVVALMLERDPSLKPLQVKNRLRSTATPLAFGSPYTTGAGLANALAAVSASDRWSGRWPSVSYGFAQRVYRDVYGQRLVWLDLAANGGVDSRGQRWSGVTWDNVAWDSVTWENLDWSAFNWLCIDITWEATISWQDMTWEDITWEVKYSRGQNKRTWAVVN